MKLTQPKKQRNYIKKTRCNSWTEFKENFKNKRVLL